jgi:hypothetical protein
MEFTVKDSTPHEWKTLMTILLSLGYVWHRDNGDELTDVNEINSKWRNKYPQIRIDTDIKKISGWKFGGDYTVKNDLFKILELVTGIGSIEVKHVAGFRATVTPDKVVVGCQTITLEKFREIEEAAKKIRA